MSRRIRAAGAMDDPHPFPHSKDSLLREVDAKTKVKDIRALYRLREAAEVKWWESGLVVLVFASAFGFLATVLFKMLSEPTPDSGPLQDKIMLFWFVPLVLAVVVSLEVYRNKLNAMRRLQEMTARMLEATRRELTDLRRAGDDQPADQSK